LANDSKNSITLNTLILYYLCILVASIRPAYALAPLLQGSVSYNPTSQLYTYSYSIDNRSGLKSIRELGVVIDSSTQNNYSLDPANIPHSVPPGYSLLLGTSGSIEDPPLNEFGMLWV
jgi:hypothetical protein